MAEPEVAVLVPFAGTDPHRLAAFDWVRARYPWPVFVGSSSEPWCKARAVADALTQTDAQMLVVADADVWCDGTARAVEAVVSGASRWAIPHRLVHRLSRDSTAEVLAGADWHGLPLSTENRQDAKPYVGLSGGGIVVVSRGAYMLAPLDPRFVGWGQEDQSWALALSTLAGRPWRGTDDLVHLWHPAQPRQSRTVGTEANLALFRRYRNAQRRPAVMRALIEEVAACPT